MDFTIILNNYLDDQRRLIAFPAKRKMKIYALFYLASKFDKSKSFTEKEVNELLSLWHTFDDPATLRRELYNNRFIDRESNGHSYWLEQQQPDLAEIEKKYS